MATKKDFYERAKVLNIRGKSTMNKEELIKSVLDAEDQKDKKVSPGTFVKTRFNKSIKFDPSVNNNELLANMRIKYGSNCRCLTPSLISKMTLPSVYNAFFGQYWWDDMSKAPHTKKLMIREEHFDIGELTVVDVEEDEEYELYLNNDGWYVSGTGGDAVFVFIRGTSLHCVVPY